MPNFKGGKKYKAGKQVETKVDFYDVNWSEGQSVGRILKPLGDRNMLVFCNDGKERICHIRGAIKKSQRITVGDLVLISIRAQEMNATQSTQKDKGDILVKYEREQYKQLKKFPGVNATLFTNIEVLDSRQRAAGISPDMHEDGIEFDYGSDGDSSDEGNSSEEGVKREEKKQVEDAKRATARTAKTAAVNDDDAVDIDAI